jgi:hypothetical protein
MNRSFKLRLSLRSLVASAALALAGCGGSHTAGTAPSSLELADVVVTATAIPSDGQCTHIVVTRLADFQKTEYRGLLAGATIKAPVGEDRVTATAYPTPCSTEPANAPWTADPQTVTFAAASPNTVKLAFHQSADVAVDPSFDDTKPLVVRGGSQVRISRNGEDTAGPNFALDGWEVKQVTLPPAPVSETVVFSLEGKGLPYTPLGMARMPDGSFVFQLSDPSAPLYVFSAAGANLDRWGVTYPATTHAWNFTDGLEAIDATHLVRTGYANRPFDCDANGDHCKQSGLDILEKRTAADGSTSLVVTQQIFLPETASEALNTEYPVGVTPVGARFAVSVLGDVGTTLVLLNADGSVAAGPIVYPDQNDLEGIFVDATGRLVGITYNGALSTYNASDLTARAGETGSLGEGVGFAAPWRLTWRSAGTGSYIAYNNNQTLVYATPDFGSITNIGLDLGNMFSLAGVEYKADTDELAVMDRFDPGTPTVVTYNLTTKARTASVTLQPGLSYVVRPYGLAYVPSTRQWVTHYRRTSGSDATLDAVVFVHNADGTLANKADLGQFGFIRIQSVRYNAAADELVLLAVDAGNTTRVVTLDRAGLYPKRSYRTDAVPGIVDLAPITSGAFVGDFGAIQSQPSYFERIALP